MPAANARPAAILALLGLALAVAGAGALFLKKPRPRSAPRATAAAPAPDARPEPVAGAPSAAADDALAGEPAPGVAVEAPPAPTAAAAAKEARPPEDYFWYGVKLYRERKFIEARPYLEYALPKLKPERADQAHALLAYVHYFYAEDEQARERLKLVKVRTSSPVRWLEACLGGPFREIHGGVAHVIEGRSGRYYLGTDVGFDPAAPDRKSFDVIGSWLDRIRKEYRATFRLTTDEALVPRVFVFARRRDYDAFVDRVGAESAHTAGVYVPALRTVAIDGSDRKRLRGTIFHEAFHQFIADFFVPAPWFNEGLAEYFGASEPVPGSELLRVGVVDRANLDTIRRAIERGEKPVRLTTPLKDLIVMGPGDFQGQSTLHYAEAWSFVHFLLHGYPEGQRMLWRYFDALRAGSKPSDARDAAFGNVSWEAMEEEWRAYVRGL